MKGIRKATLASGAVALSLTFCLFTAQSGRADIGGAASADTAIPAQDNSAPAADALALDSLQANAVQLMLDGKNAEAEKLLNDALKVEKNDKRRLSLNYLVAAVEKMSDNNADAIKEMFKRFDKGFNQQFLEKTRVDLTAITVEPGSYAVPPNDVILLQKIWDIGLEERRRGSIEAAFEVWRDLAYSRNSFRGRALVELAKHYERREKDYAAALEATLEALAMGENSGLRKREVRLRKRILAADKRR